MKWIRQLASRLNRPSKIANRIRLHGHMLDDVLCPELEEHAETRAFIDTQTQSDRRLNELLTSIETNQPPQEGWTPRLSELKSAWIDHVEQEESRLFPAAERLLGAGKLLELSDELKRFARSSRARTARSIQRGVSGRKESAWKNLTAQIYRCFGR